ncbi:hypothetical protein [Kitasatospora sp. NBC_01539]|uniref:hypothetical protein n=1 Tax=Kitasatospora sp. NBC_01539 TaxID=2903577 RepID=UPI0038602B26
MTDDWWAGRRNDLLATISAELRLWGEDDLDDPGTSELAGLTAVIGAEAAADHRCPALAEAGLLITAASAELGCADRFLGAFLPQVVRHLRAAHTLLRQARDRLADQPGPLPGARREAPCPAPD